MSFFTKKPLVSRSSFSDLKFFTCCRCFAFNMLQRNLVQIIFLCRFLLVSNVPIWIQWFSIDNSKKVFPMRFFSSHSLYACKIIHILFRLYRNVAARGFHLIRIYCSSCIIVFSWHPRCGHSNFGKILNFLGGINHETLSWAHSEIIQGNSPSE